MKQPKELQHEQVTMQSKTGVSSRTGMDWRRGLTAGLLLAVVGSTGAAWPRAAVGALRQPAAEPPEAPAAEQPEKPSDPAKQPAGDLETEETIARYQQLLERRPFHGPAFNGLVNHAIERGKLKELIEEYTKKTAALPDDVALRVVLARLHLRAGEAPAAAALLEKTEKLEGDLARMNAELLALKAEIYQRAGDNAAAEKMLKEAQGLASSVSERLRLSEALADLYIRDNRRDEAVKSLEALAAEFPDNYAHQKHIGEAMAQRGLHEAAVARYKSMLPLVKDEVDRRCEVLRAMGQSLERLDKRDEAIAAYVEAVGLLNSDHWLQRELHERIVGLYRAANRLEDLATYCTAQIARAPEQTGMRVLLADVQNAMGNPDKAKQTLAEAVELFPKDLALSQKRVEFLERLGDFDGVSAEYQRIIGQHPGDVELYVAYGQGLANNKQIDAARNQWRHVLNTKVDDAALAIRLGGLFEAYEQYDDAGEAYERAITISPSQPDAYTALTRLWLVRGDADKAVATLKRMGDANPQDATVQAALAQELRNLGKTDEALAAITRACELLPEQVKYHAIRAELLVQGGQLEEALKVRRESIDRINNTVQQTEAIQTLVSMYASAGKLADLRAKEEERVKADAGATVPRLLLARAADVERDFPAVRKHLDAILAAEPGNETALQHLAKLQDATGDIDAAVATYTQLTQRYPARARHFYEAIVDLKLRYGDRAGAIDSLQKMAQNDPASAAAQAGVAEQLMRMNEPERALPYFEKALQIQADKHDTRLDYGKALVDAGRLDDALTAFRAVATQRTDTDRAVEALGRLHDTASQLGRLEELIDELEREVDVDPSNTLVATALARLLVHELEYGRALEVLDVVLRNNPRDVNLAMARAEVLRRLARFDNAVAAYQKVLHFPQIDRDYIQGELGKTYFEAGQVDQARRVWKQVQHKLYAGSLLKNNGLLEEAITVLEEGIRLKPDEYALHRNLIGALESAGRTPDALTAARRLLDLEPGNIWNIERLAEAYVRNGDRAGAAEVAARLFSADVNPDKLNTKGTPGGGYNPYGGGYSGYGYGYGGGRSNLERGIEFFQRNGLNAELEKVINEQIAAQPDNAMLKSTASQLFQSELNQPELALKLLRELETATFPVEHQDWLGQCSQKDWMRIQQYNLIASKPVLRDKQLAALDKKKPEELTRDELLELSVIRKSQGNMDAAIELLGRAVKQDSSDSLALGVLTELLVTAEKFKEAEPHARRLVEVLSERREQMHGETVERVRRDYVRTLPLEFQLRVTDELLSDIAEQWTLGEGWSWYDAETTQSVGYLKARLTLGTILAETERMEEARAIWQDLAPKRGPDVDRLTMLGDTAELHKQEDLAFKFYQDALHAAKKLAGDPLLQQVYASSTTTRSWYGEEGVDKAFSNIVEAFSKRNALMELYDFLRDTNQESRSRRVAEQYNLGPELKKLYTTRVEEAAAAFRKSPDGAFDASTPYFAQVCKLAELSDREGDWVGASKVYEAYLKDFPDELGLLTMMGEVAETQLNTEEAIEWEKKVLDCKERLSRRAREWSLRDLMITPSIPQPLAAGRADAWSWAGRWGRNNWAYGGSRGELDRWPSWMRLAELYLSTGNTIAAADAMQQAVAEAGGRRDEVVHGAINLIQQRQLTSKMLPVLRSLAVNAPGDERVQLTFAESLEANGRKELALEVCNRMLRRGVSDLGILAEVTRRVQSLNPEQAAPAVTLATLEAEVAADAGNLKSRLRLAKAYYYSLKVDKTLEVLLPLVKEAPHLEDVHDLLVEVYTLRGDSEKLIDALKAQIDRLSDERKRRTVRWRLVDELLAAGRTDEALATVKELGDPRDPRSYSRISTLLHYFGKSDEAIAALEEGKKSRTGSRYESGGDFAVAQCLALRGDFGGAADRVMAAIDEQGREQTQYGGVYGMYESAQNPFATLEPMFALYPELTAEVTKRMEARRAAAPGDAQVIKTLIGLKKSLGRPDEAEKLLEGMAQEGASDQTVVAQQIDLAVKRRDFARAVEMAQKYIAQAPKPQIPPGMPAQYAGYAVLQSPRSFMLCKLGDVLWEMGEKDKAFETYQQIVDKKVDETRIAYATICLMRGRLDEARTLVDEALGAQQVKPPALLQFRAFIALLDDDAGKAFDLLAEAAIPGGDDNDRYGYGGGSSPLQMLSWLGVNAGQADRFTTFMQDRIKKNPADWTNYQSLVQLYSQLGRPKDVMAVLDQAGSVTALTQQVASHRHSWYSVTESDEKLIPLYEKLIDLAEREVKSSANAGYNSYDDGSAAGQHYRDELAELLWNAGKHEEAERLWTERMNTQRADAHLRLGQLYLKKQAYDKAQKAFARAVELEPENLTARMAMANEAAERGDAKALLEHMHECFVRNPSGQEPNQRYYRQSPEDAAPGRMNEWALSLSANPEVSSFLDGEAGEKAGEYRVMLATLTGDWSTLEVELKKMIDAGTTDPLAWKLWAEVQQRKGAWAEAAKALDFLRRVQLTTIGTHREQLKLVLAGKQLKEAAAGTRQANPSMPAGGAPAPSGMYSGGYSPYSSYGGYDWWDASADSTLLPSLYIKLGDFQRAERLYLISSGGDGVQGKLPWLASLMWDQQAKDRALELMRLSLTLADERSGNARNMLPQYAAMLSEAGQTKAAVDLLARSYRYDSTGDQSSMYEMIYGNTGNREFEQGYESSMASSLYGILQRAGAFETTLKEMAAASAKDPTDPRLAKLVLSLQKQGRRWAEQRDSLAARRAALPANESLVMEQLHAACQLGNWDEALSLVGELRKISPQSEDRWRVHEAFVQLMRKDGAKAVAAMEPLLAKGRALNDYYAAPPGAGAAVLAAAGDMDRLSAYLGKMRAAGDLDDSGEQMLVRIMASRGKWNEAISLAIGEFWKQQEMLAVDNQWWGLVAHIADSARLANAKVEVGGERAADAALLTLATQGPRAGFDAFTKLAAAPDATLEARRGLIFAASMTGEYAKEREANEQLVAWLASRRYEAWYRPETPGVKSMAEQAIEQMGRAGTSQTALNPSMSQSLNSMMGSRSENREVVQMYDPLWRAHAKYERALLARAGEADALRTMLLEQARTFGMSGSSGYDYEYDYYYNQNAGADQADRLLASDVPALVRLMFRRAGRMDALEGAYEDEGTRFPSAEWRARGLASAAAGDEEDGAAWRRKAAQLRLAQLRATDRPGVSSGARNPWRWSWYYDYGPAAQEVASIRAALRVATQVDRDPDVSTQIEGEADQLWEVALVDPVVEQELVKCADAVGPGWGATQTLQNLVSYYRAKEDAARVLELIERTTETDQIIRSGQLSAYVWACYRLKDSSRIESILSKAKQAGDSLTNEIALAELVAARLGGNDAKADQLESNLLARCVSEVPVPLRPDPVLLGQPWSRAQPEMMQYDPYMYRRPTSQFGLGSGLKIAPDLAGVLRVRFDAKVGADDLTVRAIRTSYQRNGLHAHAAKLLEREVSESVDPTERHTLLQAKCAALAKAGKKDDAAKAARDFEQELRSELAKSPALAGVLQWRLAQLYASPAYGPDPAKAAEALAAARKAHPACDTGGNLAVHYLYKMGRYREAWEAWKTSRRIAQDDTSRETTLYYAAFSACKGGEKDAGIALARQALYRHPQSPLAKEARELINGQ